MFIQFGCSKSVSRLFKDGYVKNTTGPRVSESFYKKQDYTISFPITKSKEIKLRYFGCGGYYMANDKSAILIDPFFSNQPFLAIPFCKIGTKTANVKYGLMGLEQDIKAKVNAVFVTHSHYDHMLDVPYVYEKYTDTAKTKIYCSSSGKNMILNVIKDTAYIVNIEDNLVSSWYQMGERYPKVIGRNSIRVTPIMAAHAPQMKNQRLFVGESDTIREYNHVNKKTRAKNWKQGSTFSYLIDFMQDSSLVEFRILIQSSAAPPKYGWINDTILSEHPVNIAIIGAATFANTTDYPSALVEHLKPQKVIICHWEDFFVPYNRKEKRTVRRTNVSKFIYSLNSVHPYKINDEEMFTMPNPGIDITVKY